MLPSYPGSSCLVGGPVRLHATISFQKDEVTVTDGAYSSLLLIALGFHTQADEYVQGMHEAKILQVNT